jgi:hypothetical protein
LKNHCYPTTGLGMYARRCFFYEPYLFDRFGIRKLKQIRRATFRVFKPAIIARRSLDV